MNKPRTHSLKKEQGEGEEHLPLYSPNRDSSESNEPNHNLLPARDASPELIRLFLTHLLTTTRSLEASHAQTIASRWSIGKGEELRSYPPAMFLEIFGMEDGWVVYREVRLCVLREEYEAKMEKATGGNVAGSVILAILFFILEAALIYGLVRSIDNNSVFFALFCGLSMVPGGFLSIAAVVGIFEHFPAQNFEKRVEEELRKCVEGRDSVKK